MTDTDRVNTLRSFLAGIEDTKRTADARGELLLIDGMGVIDFLEALLEGRDSFEPDAQGYLERSAKLQTAHRYTFGMAPTWWKTIAPTPKPSTR